MEGEKGGRGGATCLSFFFSFFRFPANPFRVVVSSRATTSWKLRGDTSWGVNECPRRCNLASINPSAGRRDVRPYDVSLIDVHEATSMPHLRRPLHEFLPRPSPFSFPLFVKDQSVFLAGLDFHLSFPI